MSLPLNELPVPILGKTSFSSANRSSYISSAGSERHAALMENSETLRSPSHSSNQGIRLQSNAHTSPISKNYSYFSSPIPSTSRLSLNVGKTGLANITATDLPRESISYQARSSSFGPQIEFPYRKSNTAPASPHHFSASNYVSIITPSTSPAGLENRMVGSTAQFSHLPSLRAASIPNISCSPTFQETTNSLSDHYSGNSTTHISSVRSGTILPSLRHLQLLPDRSLQEHSKLYPDTAKINGAWRQNVISWCKEKSYEDYVKVQEEVAKVRTQFPISQLRSHPESTKNPNMPKIPSLLNAKDQFESLSNSPWSYEAPVTPPMSPSVSKRRQNSNTSSSKLQSVTYNLTPKTPGDDLKDFTPIISERLVQTVKMKQMETYYQSSPGRHKKTNSFKALQIKKLLDNRDVLSINSKSGFKVSKPGRPMSSVIVSGISTQIASKLESISSNSSSSSASSSPKSSKRSLSRSPTRFTTFVQPSTPREYNQKQKINSSRSRSRSPIRPSTPTQQTPIYKNTFQNSDNSNYNVNSASVFSTPALKYGQSSTESPNSATFNSIGAHTTSISVTTSPKHYYSSKKISGGSNSPKRRKSNPTFTSVTSTPTASHGAKSKSGSNSPKNGAYHLRKCVSCNSSDSPCWRPSWSGKKTEQLCNSCGLRYKKTRTRCLNDGCRKIPTKGELNIMKSQGLEKEYNTQLQREVEGYKCLFCNHITETR